MNQTNQQKQKPREESVESIDPFNPSPEQAAVAEQPAVEVQPLAAENEELKAAVERAVEKEAVEAGLPQAAPAAAPAVPAKPAEIKSEQLLKIESILEEDLKDTYLRLDPKIRQKFLIEGEQAARKIEVLLREAKVKTHKIFKAIYEWLRIIPGVNKFFLRQEAKIKTDRILKIK